MTKLLTTLAVASIGACLLALLSALQFTGAQGPVPTPPYPRLADGLFVQHALGDLSWQDDPWTGDDWPYADARRNIDLQFQQSKGCNSLMLGIESIAFSNPKNSLDQFELAYAWRKYNQIPHPTRRENTTVVVALAFAPSPHTYDYTRMRFLYSDISDTRYRHVAERLLAYQPNDIEVQGSYAIILSTSSSKIDRLKGVQIEESIVKAHPDLPNWHLWLAAIYIQVADRGDGRMFYRKAVIEEKKFVSMAPLNDWHRQRGFDLLEYTNERLNGQSTLK